jgi:uncharacterized protein with HEPN domain
MPPDREAAAILDIAGAARLIADFVKGMDFEAFRADARTQSAVIHQLLGIGEAARRLSDRYRGGHPEVPWRDIVRMRDKMIRHYEAVDLAKSGRRPAEMFPTCSRR